MKKLSWFKKRKEALIVLLKALDLIGPLKVVQQHRSDIRAKEIQYWSREELEAMTRRAMDVFRNEPKRRSRAIAHIIHVIVPPRREDTASIRWDYFDLERRRLLFPAKKNGQQPGNVIQERFIPILSAWKEITSENKGTTLCLAINYGGRGEISDAVQKIARRIEIGELSADQVDENLIAENLYTSGMPDPDLLILSLIHI
mgnify:CR=1 FL=1